MKSRRMTAKSLDSFSIMEITCFTTAWSPPVNVGIGPGRPRWPDWATYFRDFDSIRPLLLASDYHQPGTVLFADTVRAALAAAAPGETWGQHRHCAWRHAHIYSPGDAHVHEGDERLGPAVEIAQFAKVPTQVVE